MYVVVVRACSSDIMSAAMHMYEATWNSIVSITTSNDNTTKRLSCLNYLIMSTSKMCSTIVGKNKVGLRLVHSCFNLGNSIHDEKFHTNNN